VIEEPTERFVLDFEKIGEREDFGNLCERKTLGARTSQGTFLRFRCGGGAVSGLSWDGKEPG
jgi:hypothetical protein